MRETLLQGFLSPLGVMIILAEFDEADEKAAIHQMVSTWATSQKLVLGHS